VAGLLKFCAPMADDARRPRRAMTLTLRVLQAPEGVPEIDARRLEPSRKTTPIGRPGTPAIVAGLLKFCAPMAVAVWPRGSAAPG
jgi:hypothetical protein